MASIGLYMFVAFVIGLGIGISVGKASCHGHKPRRDFL